MVQRPAHYWVRRTVRAQDDRTEQAVAGQATPQPLSAEQEERIVGLARDLAVGTAQVIPEDGLAEKLRSAEREGRPLRIKLGIDPSGSDLTLGHAVVLRKLRQFQDAGHIAVLIVGDFTGQVGDPTERTKTRSVLTPEQTRRNAQTYMEQALKILRDDRLELRYNSEWLAGMSLTDVLATSRNLTVAQLLERDDFTRRHRENLPITLMEFMYPMLQGMDSVAIAADCELGGTDQTFNNLHPGCARRPQAATICTAIARRVVELYHGADEARAAEDRWTARFSRRELPEDLPEFCKSCGRRMRTARPHRRRAGRFQKRGPAAPGRRRYPA